MNPVFNRPIRRVIAALALVGVSAGCSSGDGSRRAASRQQGLTIRLVAITQHETPESSTETPQHIRDIWRVMDVVRPALERFEIRVQVDTVVTGISILPKGQQDIIDMKTAGPTHIFDIIHVTAPKLVEHPDDTKTLAFVLVATEATPPDQTERQCFAVLGPNTGPLALGTIHLRERGCIEGDDDTTRLGQEVKHTVEAALTLVGRLDLHDQVQAAAAEHLQAVGTPKSSTLLGRSGSTAPPGLGDFGINLTTTVP